MKPVKFRGVEQPMTIGVAAGLTQDEMALRGEYFELADKLMEAKEAERKARAETEALIECVGRLKQQWDDLHLPKSK